MHKRYVDVTGLLPYGLSGVVISDGQTDAL